MRARLRWALGPNVTAKGSLSTICERCAWVSQIREVDYSRAMRTLRKFGFAA